MDAGICEVCGVYVADIGGHVAWHELKDQEYDALMAQVRLKADRDSHPSVAGLRRRRWRGDV